MVSKGQLCRAVVVFLCIRVSQNASLSLNEQRKYQSLIEGQGLYTANDGVIVLTSHNFNSEVYGQKNAWLIEFYNSWCGFCQRFAPSWKALAKEVQEWKDMVAIGAIDCSDDENSNICRDFDIMAYPTLRYFHENYVEGPNNKGVEVVKGQDVHSHQQNLIQRLIEEQKEGRGKIFPNLLPLNASTTDHLYDHLPAGTEYAFIIMESPNTKIGPIIILDLHKVANVVIFYAFNNNTELIKNLGVTTFPNVVAVSPTKEIVHLEGDLATRSGISTAILHFLKDKGIAVPETTTRPAIFTGKWVDVEVPDMSSLMEAREREALKQKIKMMGDVTFQMDFETALRISLKTEVGRMKTISGEKLSALKAYLNVLAKYFPFGKNGREFLNELKDRVNSVTTSIDGVEIFNMVKAAENENRKIFSSPEQWLACKGSQPQYRGYPCGLWKLFHYLTVNSAENETQEEGNVDPLEVLRAMHGYIKNFFGCADCSQHFQDMANKKAMWGVQSRESAILWLWMAHNTVNKRLAGDYTEDPEFPKIQFPIPERCSTCRTGADNGWNYPEVLKYLKHVYSSINVRYIGSDTRVLHLGLEGEAVTPSSSSIFQKIDASMCFIIYVISFGLIIILIRFFLKRGYRKKMYIHDVLGKV